jgi:DNA-binding response OmpR family regulator
MRILIIEDNKEVSDYIVKGMTEAGHNCVQAFDGKDGLLLATTEIFGKPQANTEFMPSIFESVKWHL